MEEFLRKFKATGRGKGGKNVPARQLKQTHIPTTSSVATSENTTSIVTAPPLPGKNVPARQLKQTHIPTTSSVATSENTTSILTAPPLPGSEKNKNMKKKTPTQTTSSVASTNNTTSNLTAPSFVVPPLLVKVLLCLSISIGIIFVMAAGYNGTWWYLFLLVFYVLAPIPLFISSDGMSSTNPRKELALFVTFGIVVLAFYLPLVLARIGGIFEWQDFLLSCAGNIFVFIPIWPIFSYSWK